jgi:hypothetical protein
MARVYTSPSQFNSSAELAIKKVTTASLNSIPPSPSGDLCGDDAEPELFLQRSCEGATNCIWLQAVFRDDLNDSAASLVPEHGKHGGLFCELARRGRRRSGRRRPCGSLCRHGCLRRFCILRCLGSHRRFGWRLTGDGLRRRLYLEGKADAAKQGYEVCADEGRRMGSDVERARIKAILTLPGAKGREASANHLALNTPMSAEEASGALAGLGKTGGISARAAGTIAPAAGAEHVPNENMQPGAVSWASIADRLNAETRRRAGASR